MSYATRFLEALAQQAPEFRLTTQELWPLTPEPVLPPLAMARVRSGEARDLLVTCGFGAAPPLNDPNERFELAAWLPLDAPYREPLVGLLWSMGRAAFKGPRPLGDFAFMAPGPQGYGFLLVPLGAVSLDGHLVVLRMPFPVRADEADDLNAQRSLETRTAWFKARGGADEQLRQRFEALFQVMRL